MEQPKPTTQNPKIGLKATIFALIGIIFTTGTFYIERQSSLSFSKPSFTAATSLTNPKTTFAGDVEVLKGSAESHNFPENYKFHANSRIKTQANARAEIEIDKNVFLRMDQNTEVEFPAGSPSPYPTIKLHSGRIWINNKYSEYPLQSTVILNEINENTSTATVPFESVTQITHQDNGLLVNTHYGTAKVAFGNQGGGFYSLVNNDQAINSFLINTNYQATIFNNKITEQLRPLLYSKIVKEFNYGRTDQNSLKEDQWAQWNIKQDQELQIRLIEEQEDQILKRGLQISPTSIENNSINQIEETFTLSNRKLMERKVKRAFKDLEDAEFLLLTNEPGPAQIRINQFKQKINQIKSDPDAKSEISWRLMYETLRTKPIPPGHSLYTIKELIAEESLAKETDSSGVNHLLLDLRPILIEAVSTTPIDYNNASNVFAFYQKQLNLFLNKNQNELIKIPHLLEEENQILGQAIGQYPELYNLDIFNIKSTLEEAWLDTIPVGPDLREQKQTLILEKTRILEKLRAFFFDEKISVEDAKDVVPRIIQEIEKYQDERTQVAVQQIFAERLADFEQFLRYLNSPEYSSAAARRIHGNTHKERYQKFLAAIAENKEISALEDTILGDSPITETSTTETPEAIILEAKTILTNAGLENPQLEPILSATEKDIIIKSASYQGQLIQAEYDWRRKIIKNINYKNKIISLKGVKAEKFADFIQAYDQASQAGTSVDTDEFTTPEASSETKIERTARALIKQKLTEVNIQAPLKTISIIDLDQAKFRIENLEIEAQEIVTISFDYQSRTNEITNITLTAEIGTVETPGPIDLSTTNINSFISTETQKIREAKIAEQEELRRIEAEKAATEAAKESAESTESKLGASLLDTLIPPSQPEPEIDAEREAAKAALEEIIGGDSTPELPSGF